MLIAAYREFEIEDLDLHYPYAEQYRTPLEQKYITEKTEYEKKHSEAPVAEKHWNRVLIMMRSFREVNSGFMASVKRLELLSEEMIDKNK